MIYGHLEEWMVRENPAFARAVEDQYSILTSQKNAAAFGQIAYWEMAEILLSRLPEDPSEWSEEDRSRYLPLFARAAGQLRQIREAVRSRKAGKYFRKLAAGFAVLERYNKRKRQAEENPIMEIEYIFEAYYFLRQRDGEGSPLPLKKEVRFVAAQIRAFDVVGLMDKLPQFLWKSNKRILTDLESARIRQLLGRYLGPDKDAYWTYWLKKAGLGDSLRQASRK